MVAAADADPSAGAGTALEIGSPCWNHRAEESNFFTKIYDVHHGTGVKLGPAITISALLIQGPFPTEDKADHEEHRRRQVQSGMLTDR